MYSNTNLPDKLGYKETLIWHHTCCEEHSLIKASLVSSLISNAKSTMAAIGSVPVSVNPLTTEAVDQ